MHLLEPGEGLVFHVERRDTEVLIFGGLVEIKELFDHEDPTECVSAINTGNIKLDGGVGERVG